MKTLLKLTPLGERNNRGGWLAAAFLVCFVNSIPSMAGQSDAYRYVLKSSHNKKLCDHMEEVYNRHFKHPFAVSTDPADFVEGGRYALPLLLGVTHDPELAKAMALSISPTSPEFDAVKWREGRVQYPNGNDQAVMVADVDIDNDGSVDTVVKFFFAQPYLINNPLSVDALAVYRGVIKPELLPFSINALYIRQDGVRTPANIGANFGQVSSSSFPYAILRVFSYDGANYLSAYGRRWIRTSSALKHRWPDLEYIDVLQYHGGGDNLGKEGWSQLKMDTICQFRMTVINKRNTGSKQ